MTAVLKFSHAQANKVKLDVTRSLCRHDTASS